MKGIRVQEIRGAAVVLRQGMSSRGGGTGPARAGAGSRGEGYGSVAAGLQYG
jgi:hypothetical protein